MTRSANGPNEVRDYRLRQGLSENARRIRDGVKGARAGKIIEFAKKKPDLIVVFDEPFGKFSGGRISLFQQFIADNIGVVPEFIKSIPACVKVVFSLGPSSEDNIAVLRKLLKSAQARRIYSNLRISQIQLSGDLIFVESSRTAPSIFAPPHP